MSVDFVLDSNSQDLLLDRGGDLVYQAEPDSIVRAFGRRLTTPPQGYARLVRSTTQVFILDANYGSNFSEYLSLPRSEINANLGELKKVAVADGRLTVTDATLVNFLDSQGNVIPNAVGINLTYTIPNQVNSISVTLSL